MFETLDLILRSACIGICLLLIVHFLSIRPISRKSISTIAMFLASGSMILVTAMTASEMFGQSSIYLFFKQMTIATSAPLIAWGLLELFEDDFEIEGWQIAFVSISFVSHFLIHVHPVFDLFCHVSNVLIYAYVGYVAFATHKHDLVDERCRIRKTFMGGAALAGITFTSMHLLIGDGNLPIWYFLFKALVILGLAINFAYWALSVRERLWALPQNRAAVNPESLNPAELSLLTRLQESMSNQIWRQEGLTIGRLAEALDAPEHRLRKVINQGLGYRNFAAFVNEHRIGAACEVLSDPVKADIPIINIAYDVGYASLGPFNRAFREIVGESPTEYRKQAFTAA